MSVDLEVGQDIVGDQVPQGYFAPHHLLEPVGQRLVFSFWDIQEQSRKAEG